MNNVSVRMTLRGSTTPGLNKSWPFELRLLGVLLALTTLIPRHFFACPLLGAPPTFGSTRGKREGFPRFRPGLHRGSPPGTEVRVQSWPFSVRFRGSGRIFGLSCPRVASTACPNCTAARTRADMFAPLSFSTVADCRAHDWLEVAEEKFFFLALDWYDGARASVTLASSPKAIAYSNVLGEALTFKLISLRWGSRTLSEARLPKRRIPGLRGRKT